MEPHREPFDQEAPDRQELLAEGEFPLTPTFASGQLAAAPRHRSKLLVTRKSILLCLLALVVISVGVVVVVVKLQPPSGREKWARHLGNLWGSSLTVNNRVVYVGTQDNRVFALDAASGQVLWSTQLGHYTDFGTAVQSSIIPKPAVSDGIVYANSQDGFLYALDASTGHTRWSYQVTAQAGPVVAQGIVYVDSEDGAVSAIDAASGRKLWFAQAHDGLGVSLVEANGLLYVVGPNRGVQALDALSGQEQWVDGIGSDNPPALANGLVYVTTVGGLVYALDAHSGQLHWLGQQTSGFSSGPVVVGEMLFVNSFGGVFALNRADGGERWFSHLTMPVTPTAPAVASGTVYVGSGDATTVSNGVITSQPDEKLYALDAASGKERWFYQLEGAASSTPVVSQGVIYVGAGDGTLYALLPPG